jgi:glycosyltransferase involved in cell wall biosynthesis
LKLAVLYSHLAGYTAACLTEFRRQTAADVLVFAHPQSAEAPFADEVFSGLGDVRSRQLPDKHIEAELMKFHPDAVLVAGWSDRGYNRICRRVRKIGIPVIAGCDTQWTGSIRQRIAGLVANNHLHSFVDVLWVTGERQRTLAAALGFRGQACWEGFYACDWNRFAAAGRNRDATSDEPHFLYVGRYAPEKGLDVLAAAYSSYRHRVAVPWALRCAGAGPLRNLLLSAGAEDIGFIQPESLPQTLSRAAAFVLPSRREPWGVALHEAAACGLPLIASDACGAAVHLVRHGWSGYKCEPGNPEALATLMVRMHGLDETAKKQMGKAAHLLSQQYTPALWAATLSHGISALHAAV